MKNRLFVIAFLLLLAVFSAHAQLECVYLQQPELAITYVDSCAQFWLGTWDQNLGGFYTNVDREGDARLDWGSNKNMITQSRNAYGLVRAYNLTGDLSYLELAHDALEWMNEYAWDADHRGWYGDLNQDGSPSNRYADKTAFNQHYALLGLAAYVETTRDTAMMAKLLEGYQHLEDVYWDDREDLHGYYDVTSYTNQNPRLKSFNATVDAITTHLLLLELMTEEESYLEKLELLGDEVINHLVASMPDQAIGFVEEYGSDWNWNNQETMTIMGHVLKSAWCLGRIYRLTHNPVFLDGAETLFYDVWDLGYDHALGGPYKDYNRTTGEMLMWGNPDTAKAWWQMEQGITAGLMLNGLIGENDPLTMADESLNFFMEHFVDHQYGEVYENRTRYGEETWGTTKGNGGKAGYHSIETGYYNYLYGNLLLLNEPATLYYHFEPLDEPREVILTPIAIEDERLVISGVEHNGEPYTDYNSENRILNLASGTGGEFVVTFTPSASAVAWDDDKKITPAGFSVSSVYPNPFNSRTILNFTLDHDQVVTVDVFNLNGRKVMSAQSRMISAGSHSYPLSFEQQAAGTYFVRIQAGRESQVEKVLLVK